MRSNGYVGDFNSMAKGEDKAWVWLSQTIYNLLEYNQYDKALKEVHLSSDDIAQDTLCYLVEHKNKKGIDLAKQIYENKNIGLLFEIVRKKIDERNGSQFFDTSIDYSRYKRIHAVCLQYNIVEDPRNAYLISHIINDARVFSIDVVERILEKKKPLNLSYEKMFEDPLDDFI